ncbi:hypothetical protein MKX01_031025 [Papaver californicum]|nr:hypothetical protein MKX01_031025 [Papaver californicum]
MSQVSREKSKFVDKYDVTLDVCMSSVLSEYKIISTQSIDLCVEDETVNYLNREDVKKALHTCLVGLRRWEVCSNTIYYNIEIPTTSIVGSLVKAGIPFLVYSGNQDFVNPLTWSRKLDHGLDNNILSFITIRRACHEALFSQPERSLVLFKVFLEGRPLPDVLF